MSRGRIQLYCEILDALSNGHETCHSIARAAEMRWDMTKRLLGKLVRAEMVSIRHIGLRDKYYITSFGEGHRTVLTCFKEAIGLE